MKKVLLMSAMLLIALVAQAQVKVSPKMAKGDTKNYTTKVVMELAGQSPVTITGETTYTVTDATADGYLVSMTTTEVSSDAAADNMVGRLLMINYEMMKGHAFILKTDKDGRVLGLQNFEAVKKDVVQSADKLVDELLKQMPQIKDVMPKETLMSQVTEEITEQKLVEAMLQASSIMALNGKTIGLGAQDEYTNGQGMKMKRMYLVGGQNKITTTAKLDNDPEAMKKLIIEQVEKMAPDQAEMIKQNIDAVMASGMVKFESDEKATYELADDGWVKTLDVENDTNSMGQSVKTTTNIRLK